MKELLNLSNAITFLRGPLALLFLVESQMVRLIAIFLAMVTDFADGYIARRFKFTSRVGAVFDPLMDKFFVLMVLGIFFFEGRIALWQACAMISRDFYLCIFGVYLQVTDQWKEYRCRAIRWGKVITTLQFCVLIALTFNITLPTLLYPLFILLGSLAFIELFQMIRQSRSKHAA